MLAAEVEAEVGEAGVGEAAVGDYRRAQEAYAVKQSAYLAAEAEYRAELAEARAQQAEYRAGMDPTERVFRDVVSDDLVFVHEVDQTGLHIDTIDSSSGAVSTTTLRARPTSWEAVPYGDAAETSALQAVAEHYKQLPNAYRGEPCKTVPTRYNL